MMTSHHMQVGDLVALVHFTIAVLYRYVVVWNAIAKIYGYNVVARVKARHELVDRLCR